MKKQATKLMKEREVLIADAMETLSILGADMSVRTVEVEKVIEKTIEVPVEVEKIVTIKDTAEIERLQQIIAERDELIKSLQAQLKSTEARKNISVDLPPAEKNVVVKKDQPSNAGEIEIHAEDESTLHGYYLRPEGDSIKKTPFTCGRKTSSPIVYGQGMMQYSDVIGKILVDKGLVKNHKTKIELHTMPIKIRDKEVEMLVYKDKTGALVGAIDQRCTFTKHPNCKFPLVTQMKTFIDNGVHQITNADGSKVALKGYASDKTHESYKFAIADALAKFEAMEAKKLEELLSNEPVVSAEDMFNQQFDVQQPVAEKEVEVSQAEAEYFAQMEAMFGTMN